MSNATHRRDRWETMTDVEVLRDVAQSGLHYGEDCDDDLRARIEQIAARLADPPWPKCGTCGRELSCGPCHEETEPA